MDAIRWGVAWPGGHACFELRSGEAQALQRARQLFHCFLEEDCTEEPRCRWEMVALPQMALPRVASDENQPLAWRPCLREGDLPDVDGELAFHENPRQLDRALTTIEYASLWNLIYAGEPLMSAHAALLEKDGRGVLIAGPKYAGKSTLACTLWRNGWNLLGDDVALLDPAAALAFTAPRRVSLRHGSRELVGEALWQKVLSAPSCSESAEGYLFAPGDVAQNGTPKKAVKLSALLFLARKGGPYEQTDAPAPTAYQPLLPAKALTALMPYTNKVRLHGAGAALAQLAPLVNLAPAFDMARQTPGAMAQTVETILNQEAS